MAYESNSMINSAILSGDEVKANVLARAGNDLEKSDKFGRTALLNAAIEGWRGTVELLLQNNADVNSTDAEQWTALHFAAQNHDVETCQSLLSAGAKINAVNSAGNSPLWVAEMNRRESRELQEFLIGAGADRLLENNYGVSPDDIANA